MTDADFVLEELREGPCTTMELIHRSQAVRGFGLTPHSRVAELRKRGHRIECRRIESYRGRPVYEYELIVVPEQLELSA